MEITSLDSQLSTANQNGRHLAIIFFFYDLIFFFIIPLKPGICRFSGSASLLALSVFACNRKRGYGGHLYFLITKLLVNAITWKIINVSLQFFMWCFPWVQSMEMTWIDFQLSTDNQNSRHLAIKFFLRFPSKPGIYRFSGSASLLALSILVCDW